MTEALARGTTSVVALARDDGTVLDSGTVALLDNQIDQTTGTLKLKAIFQNQDTELFPNQFVNARLLVDTQHGVTLVPTAAIQRNAQGAFVYVIGSDSTASLRTVTVGTTDANTAAVQGLNAGEVIAVNGFDKLQSGAKVIVSSGNGSGANKGNGSNGNGGANKGSQAPPSSTPGSSTSGGTHP